MTVFPLSDVKQQKACSVLVLDVLNLAGVFPFQQLKAAYAVKPSPLYVEVATYWGLLGGDSLQFHRTTVIQSFRMTHLTFEKSLNSIGALVQLAISCPREPLPTY